VTTFALENRSVHPCYGAMDLWRSLRRLFTPSLCDCLLVSQFLWLFAGIYGWQALLADGDTGWHIRTGDFILASKIIPRRDLFSFSLSHAPWYAWEWLADVIFALLHKTWGLAGVVVGSATLIVGTSIVLFRHMLWKNVNSLVALILTLLTVSACSIHYLARPHLFSLLLFAVCQWILDYDREQTSRVLWVLVPLTVLWVNLHGGFVVLLAAIGLLMTGSLVETWVNAGVLNRHALFRYIGLAAACSAASLLNPYGFQLHLHIAGYLSSDWIREAVDEFQAPRFRSENLFHYELLLIATLVTVGTQLTRRRITPAVSILFWAHFSLISTRHVPIFVITAVPVVGAELSRILGAWSAHRPGSFPALLYALGKDLTGVFGRISLWGPAALLAVVLLYPASRWPRDFPETKFPTAMVTRHKQELASSRVFTSDQWGDYLIYKNWPSQKIFIDGRSDFYGPQVGRLYLQIINGQGNWEQVLNGYAVDKVLCPREWPLAALLMLSPGWRLLDKDRLSCLFVRSGRRKGEPAKALQPHVR